MKKTIALMLCLLAGLSLVSCSDEESDELQSTNVVANLSINYSAILGDAWYEFFDIEVTQALGGESTTTTWTCDNSTVLTLDDVELSEGDTYVFRVVATPKSTLPEIDEDATYDFSRTLSAVVSASSSQQGTIFYKTSSNSTTLSAKGDKVSTFAAQERTLIDFSYTYTKAE